MKKLTFALIASAFALVACGGDASKAAVELAKKCRATPATAECAEINKAAPN